MNFASDNAAGMAPEILAALTAANDGFALGYGNDDWTRDVERRVPTRARQHHRVILAIFASQIEPAIVAQLLELAQCLRVQVSPNPSCIEPRLANERQHDVETERDNFMHVFAAVDAPQR